MNTRINYRVRNNRLKINHLVLLIIFLILLFMTSCGGSSSGSSSSGSSPSNPPPGLYPPTNVCVTRENGVLRVDWSEGEGAEYYQLLRKDGESNLAPVPNANIIMETSWQDTDYPKDKTVQYSVVSRNSRGASEPSAPSNPISEQVQELKASVLQYNDKISLRWAIHPEEPDCYRIYRSTSRANIFSEDNCIETTSSNYFDDNVSTGCPEKDTLYYYGVTWMKDGNEYGKAGQETFGFYSSYIDVFEPNNERSDVKDKSLNIENSHTAYTFAFADKTGGCQIDEDWYSYYKGLTSEGETLQLEIKLTENTFRGKLRVEFYDEYGTPKSSQVLNNDYNLCNEYMDSNTTIIYFKIEPASVTGEEGLGSYTLTLN